MILPALLSVLDFKKNNKEFNHPAFWGAFSVILNSRYN
jgi:CHAT domain-containing protein